MQRMYLRSVEDYDSPDERGTMIRRMKEAGQPVPQIQHLFAFKPSKTKYLARFTQEVMRGESALTPGQREMIAAFTSRRNKCPF